MKTIDEGWLHKIIRILTVAYTQLGAPFEASEIERLSVIVFDVMEARWRKYHTIEHIFSIVDSATAVQALAGIFHDLVYLQVDRRIHPKLSGLLREFEFTPDYSIKTLNAKFADDPVSIVNQVFGFKGDQILTPTSGANEYLSAIVAARTLDSKLTRWDLIQVLACIELTIPFRPHDEHKAGPPEWLEQRLVSLNQTYKLFKNEYEIKGAVSWAVEVANRDVASFALEDLNSFLTNTWQLVLEGNPIFKNPMYTSTQYRLALTKVDKFYSFLKSELIYHRAPELVERATKNLKLGKEYIQSKLVTAAIIESVAELTGGPGPMVLFMGEPPRTKDSRPKFVEDYLDFSIPEVEPKNFNETVKRILSKGLHESLEFDVKNATISSYLYCRFTTRQRIFTFNKVTDLFEKRIQPLEFLESFDKPLIISLIKALRNIATPRYDQLSNLIKKLS